MEKEEEEAKKMLNKKREKSASQIKRAWLPVESNFIKMYYRII